MNWPRSTHSPNGGRPKLSADTTNYVLSFTNGSTLKLSCSVKRHWGGLPLTEVCVIALLGPSSSIASAHDRVEFPHVPGIPPCGNSIGSCTGAGFELHPAAGGFSSPFAQSSSWIHAQPTASLDALRIEVSCSIIAFATALAAPRGRSIE